DAGQQGAERPGGVFGPAQGPGVLGAGPAVAGGPLADAVDRQVQALGDGLGALAGQIGFLGQGPDPGAGKAADARRLAHGPAACAGPASGSDARAPTRPRTRTPRPGRVPACPAVVAAAGTDGAGTRGRQGRAS